MVTNVGGMQAENMSVPSTVGGPYDDANASQKKALLIWSNGTASRSLSTSGPANQIRVRARGDQCEGAPRMLVRVNGMDVMSREISSSSWTSYTAPVKLPKGTYKIEVAFTNDYRSTCDRNLRVDLVQLRYVSVESSPNPVVSGNPFVGESFYVDPNSPAANSGISKIANNPVAAWFGDWNSNIQNDVNNYVTKARNANALPVMVAYNIPIRDCGSYSSGGATSAEAYKVWINSFANGINGRKSVVVLEPDAIPLQHCLNDVQKKERNLLLEYAINTLSAKGAAVYLDAGHSNWHSAAETADRLRLAGIAGARGFALNVSNFEYTSSIVAFGNDVSSRVGKPYIVDTSRNGLGPGDTWCNPSGRALGERPTANTGEANVDAYFWIKPPGESDGTCNGGPPAGQFWVEYAQGLADRAAY